MSRRALFVSLALAAGLAGRAAWAVDPPPAPDEGAITAQEFLASLHFQSGEIALGDGLALLHLADDYRFLDAVDTERLLVEAWGNPPGQDALGMIFPAGVDPLGKGSWGVVLGYDADGHVDDADAASIDYAALLEDLKQGARDSNAGRMEAGFEEVELLGWAAPPHYDAESHKLHWAKQIRFGDQADHILNYDIRVLGREGVLVLTAVSSMSELDPVRAAMTSLLPRIEFAPGQRYADYQPGRDKLAAYGLSGLIAGGALAKAGVFKWLLGALLAAKKIVIPLVAALAMGLVRLVRRRSEPPDPNRPTPIG
jgi:uncharacterized membrane-anchored protein